MGDELNLEELKEKYPKLVQQIIDEHNAEKRKMLEEELRRQKEEDEHIQELVKGREAEIRGALGLDESADLVAEVKKRAGLLAEVESGLRAEFGLGETDDLVAEMKKRKERLEQLEEQERRREVAAYVEKEVGGLKYPDWLKEQMLEALREAGPQTIEEAKQAIVARRKEYDGIMAKLELAAMGHRDGLSVLGPVLERETGVPEFARGAHLLTESLVRAGLAPERNLLQPKTVNERFAARYLKRFDELYKHHLLAEARILEEAEQTGDLSLPYTVSRAVVAEAFPRLIATSVFDVDMAQSSDERVYYEAYSGESGESADVADEAVTSDEDAWVELDNNRLRPGTVVVTPDGGGAAFVEGDDYVVDYANGRLFTISAANGGSIGDGTALDVDYTYYAYRKGEMQGIERGKGALSYTTLTMEADRLATQISREAVVFSRSQIGWDATAKTLDMLVRQVQRRIDEGLLYLALAAALKVANNSGGTWDSAAETIEKLVHKVGFARVKVANRYYEPTAILLSLTNSDRVANWEGFTAAGKRPDADLSANGYVGRLKGLPVFETTEFSDSYVLVLNRQVVIHRVYQPLQLLGPFPSYDANRKLLAADQYYAEEFNGSDCPVPEKAAYVKVV